MKHFSIKLLLLFVTIITSYLSAYAQQNVQSTPQQFPVLYKIRHIQVDVDPNKSKINFNDPSYQNGSKYTPPDWWVNLWNFAKFLSNLLYNTHTYTDQPASDMADNGFPHGPYIPTLPAFSALPAANSQLKKGFWEWGVGIGIGMKGTEYDYGGGSKAKDAILYLKIPNLMLRYNYILPGSGAIFGGLGAYYAVALSGHYKTSEVNTKLNFGNSNTDNYRRGDFGVQAQAGYRFVIASQSFIAGLNSDWGLRNIEPSNAGIKAKTRQWALILGYEF